MSKKKKEQRREQKEVEARELAASPKVKMKFGRSMFYTDQLIPLYEKDIVYEIEPQMVTRWLKRGGEIVEDLVPQKPVEPETEKTEDQAEDKE